MLDRFDWGNALVVGHNMSEFDSLILSHHFGIVPRAYACTLQMARRWIELELPVAGRVLLISHWRGHSIEEAAKEARLSLTRAMKVWVQMGESLEAFAAAGR